MEFVRQPVHPTADAPRPAPRAISQGLEAIALPDGMYVCSPSCTDRVPPASPARRWSIQWISSLLAVLGLLMLLGIVGAAA